MSNEAALQRGAAKAKRLIEDHIVNQILTPLLGKLVDEATMAREESSNMTGNTVNSYGGALFVNGSLRYLYLPGYVSAPLRGKLKDGDVFEKEWPRWDGSAQAKSFSGSGNDGSAEPNAIKRFLSGYKPQSNGYEIVIANGVEYATYQENNLNLDVLTANFDYAKMFAPSMFKPMPD